MTKACREDKPCEECSRCIYVWATERNLKRYGSESYPGRDEARQVRGDLENLWLALD